MSVLDGFRWSFSKLEVAASCPFAFKKIYMDGVKPAANPFAQLGSLCHDLLARHEQGELAVYDLLPAFLKRYPKIVNAEWPAFPLNLEERTCQRIADYFRVFNGFPFRRILMVEEKLIGTLCDRPFSGIIDLLAEDQNGRIILVDHKTSSISEYRGRKLQHHKRQLLLYAHLLRQCCHIQVDAIAFNLIKEGEWLEFPWSELEESCAVSWALGIMGAVEGLAAVYYEQLPPVKQQLQQLMMQGHSSRSIRTELHLSPRRMKRYLMEMDELALIFLEQKASAGDFGCQYICSARSHCEEGGVS